MAEPREVSGSRLSWAAYYGEIASRYENMVFGAGYRLPEIVFDLLRPLLLDKRPKVLDIGIGTGLSTVRFADHADYIIGIDGSQEMLDICAERAFARQLIKFDLTSGNLPELKLKFDVIICLGVYEFVARPTKFLENIVRYLEPGGMFVLAIRDLGINPKLSMMRWGRFKIDRRAFEDFGLKAFHHDVRRTLRTLRRLSMEIVLDREVFGYKSPTQGVDTMNRLLIARKTE